MATERSFENTIARTFTAAVSVYLATVFFFYVFSVPVINLTWFRMTGQLLWVNPAVNNPDFQPQPYDHILQIGGYNFQLDYTMPIHIGLPALVTEHFTLPLLIEHEGEILQGEWPLERPDGSEIFRRVLSFFPIFVFQGAALAVMFFLRPTDLRWRLLIVNFSIGALLITTGYIGNLNYLFSDYILPIAVWAWSVTLFHLFWIYPQALARVPLTLFVVLYVSAVLLGLAEILRFLPPYSFISGFVLCFIACSILLLLHLFKPGQRRAVILFLVGFNVILLLMTTLVMFVAQENSQSVLTWITYIVFPALPIAILFPIVNLQMPGLGMRANQAFIILLYLTLLAGIALLGYPLIQSVDLSVEGRYFLFVLLGLITAGASLYVYPTFKHWVQKILLGIPVAPEDLIQHYTGQISTSPEPSALTRLLTGDIMPALLVRQAVFYRVNPKGEFQLLTATGLTPYQIPQDGQLALLLKTPGQYLPPEHYEDSKNSHWVRLVLKLEAADHLVGLCLFGQRDPDDFYSAEEIPFLQSLMDQTALALHNIEQAERLHAYYQTNITRYEDERLRLARDLHDDVLGQMALIQMSLPSGSGSEDFHTAFNTAVARVRRIMNGLRPATLEYGLKSALVELVDDLQEQALNTAITYDITDDESSRYPRDVETHLYRIVQETFQNAIRHGQARHIIVYGSLAPTRVSLGIIDNGKGFVIEPNPDLSSLLKNGHNGLVNIYERAQIISAKVEIQSTLDKGTIITIEWDAVPPK